MPVPNVLTVKEPTEVVVFVVAFSRVSVLGVNVNSYKQLAPAARSPEHVVDRLKSVLDGVPAVHAGTGAGPTFVTVTSTE
jgi:hypothetical protein